MTSNSTCSSLKPARGNTLVLLCAAVAKRCERGSGWRRKEGSVFPERSELPVSAGAGRERPLARAAAPIGERSRRSPAHQPAGEQDHVIHGQQTHTHTNITTNINILILDECEAASAAPDYFPATPR